MKITFQVYDEDSKERICDKPFKTWCSVKYHKKQTFFAVQEAHLFLFIYSFNSFSPISFMFYINFCGRHCKPFS